MAEQERFNRYFDIVEMGDPIRYRGRISQAVGLVMESIGPPASVGEICTIGAYAHPMAEDGPWEDRAEVVGFRDNRILLMPLGDVNGIGPGSEVTASRTPFTIGVGEGLLGRVIDGLGEPIDGKGSFGTEERRPVYSSPPRPLERKRIKDPIATGIRAIDSLVTCGKGQRMGIFSGSGVGKSVLLGMIARNTGADVSVIALVGERGREVREFIERDLGEEGLRRSVVVVVTSDQAALIRLKGALVATTIAEYFRDQGMDVMLMMDSLTRIAMAQREIGLAIGEPPTTKGYTPSVFAFLPKLLERGGNGSRGSITGLYTVLVEGDDMDEPVSDTVKAILDGHIVLSRKLASLNHYPAIDVLESVSRVMIDVVSTEHMEAARRASEILATYREAEDLINIGAYARGSNPKIDYAISTIDPLNSYLRQDIHEKIGYEESVDQLMAMVSSKNE